MDLPILLYNSGLFYSALTLADYSVENEQLNEENVIFYRLIVAHSLFRLNLYHRCLRYIEKYEQLLKFTCIRVVFLKLNSLIQVKSNNLDIFKSKEQIQIEIPEGKISNESIELHFQGVINSDHIKKTLLCKAFAADRRNFESLLVLKRECLVTDEELEKMISVCDISIADLYKKVLFYNKRQLHSPFFCENVALSLYNKKTKQDLIFIGMNLLDRYPEESTSLFVYGLANIILKKYSDAKIIFYEAIKKERAFGPLWIFLGMTYSKLREYETAISAFEYSKRLMIGSYKPDFYLALEYHKMSNMNLANKFYLNSLRIKKETRVILQYCSLLINFEFYTEALKLLKSLKMEQLFKNQHLLLLSYGFLFTGEIEKAKVLLEEADKDWKYHATRGYLAHLQSKIEEASEFYTNAIIERGRSWIIEDLLKNAIELKDLKKENLVYDYGSSLFEYLNLKLTDSIFSDIWN